MNYKNLFLILISGLLLTGCGKPPEKDYDCLIEINGTCITKISKTPSENGNYWLGATKVCGGVNNMPTITDLARIATYVYDGLQPFPADEDRKNLKSNDKFKIFDLYKSGYFFIFSDETEQAKKYAYVRTYYPRLSEWASVMSDAGSNIITVCVKH